VEKTRNTRGQIAVAIANNCYYDSSCNSILTVIGGQDIELQSYWMEVFAKQNRGTAIETNDYVHAPQETTLFQRFGCGIKATPFTYRPSPP
jgi:hypothetical protein